MHLQKGLPFGGAYYFKVLFFEKPNRNWGLFLTPYSVVNSSNT